MPTQYIMEGPGSDLLEMDGLLDGLGMVSTLFENPNSNMTIRISDIQERPQVVENNIHLTKNNYQASAQLGAIGMNSLNARPTYFADRATNEDIYVSMPTQEIDCSKLYCIEEEFSPEYTGIPEVNKLNPAEKDSRWIETVREETLPVNDGKNCEPEFIPQKCEKKKNPPYLVSCTVHYWNDALTICGN